MESQNYKSTTQCGKTMAEEFFSPSEYYVLAEISNVVQDPGTSTRCQFFLFCRQSIFQDNFEKGFQKQFVFNCPSLLKILFYAVLYLICDFETKRKVKAIFFKNDTTLRISVRYIIHILVLDYQVYFQKNTFIIEACRQIAFGKLWNYIMFEHLWGLRITYLSKYHS